MGNRQGTETISSLYHPFRPQSDWGNAIAGASEAIYAVAEFHDLYIIEDDPYYFIQLEGPASQSQFSTEEYFGALLPSYLSLDVSGRVLRMDTSSKILAPGLRCGWITGSSQVIGKFLSQVDISTTSPSGPAQVMLYKLLDETWGHQGLFKWLAHLSAQCRHRRNVLVEACNRYLPLEICHWSTPTTGMFLWVRLDLTQHPEALARKSPLALRKLGHHIEDRIYASARASGVIVSKGSWFDSTGQRSLEVCFRLTFAAAPVDFLRQGVQRFGLALHNEFR